MKNSDLLVTKKCPVCGWRILDRVTPATGIIEVKCPKCGQRVKLNLAFRIACSTPPSVRNSSRSGI